MGFTEEKGFVMTLISITGASGTMGTAAIDNLMTDLQNRLRILLRKTKRGKKALRRIRKKYRDRMEVIFGDIRDYNDCEKLCDGADYLLHLSAVIPPKADHDEKLTLESNCGGTANLIRAVLETGNQTRLFLFQLSRSTETGMKSIPGDGSAIRLLPVLLMYTDRAKRSRNTTSWNPA